MLALKIPLKDAEKWKKYLVDTDSFDTRYRFKKDKSHIYFPIKKRFEIINGKVEFVDLELESAKASGTLKEHLLGKLSKEEMDFVKTAHDIIGNIAILEIPKDLEHHELLIAETLLKTNKNIKTVLKKAAIHEGTFRTQKMNYLAGTKTKETLYKENNAIMKLDVEKVYFSIRLGNERKRIMRQVKQGENILVMFSGAAPYPVVLSKNTKAKNILGIEINPDGHKYGLENIRLNKCKNVELICGDVHDIAPKLAKENKAFDRIIMPLPKTADEFLDDALSLSRKGTIIHFYDFLDDKNFDDAKNKIGVACKKNGLKYEILDLVKCGQHAPHVFRICVDFKIV
ncbi:MAG: class I SAM-dependent methyltransferase [Candidatus Woesearchaeota archaeon]